MSKNAEISALGAALEPERARPRARTLALNTCLFGLLLAGCGRASPTPATDAAGSSAGDAGMPGLLGVSIDSVVAGVMAEDRIPGAAVVWVHDGEVVLRRAYGLADVSTLRPVTVDGTVFRIGSITKLVTAVALIQFVDRGFLGLDDAVTEHLPELAAISPSGAPILVRHLLNHTGGFDQVGERRRGETRAKRPTIRAFLEQELVPLRDPGVVGAYDTYGITLAGHLVERMSGLSYGDYVRQNIFEPLEMRSSWVEVPDSARHRLATGYGIEDGELVAQDYEWYVTLPASSVDATAGDMGRFLAALLGDGGGVLSPGMLERVRSERLLSYGDMGAFSWGFWEEQDRGYRALHHGGVMAGYSSELYLVPEQAVGFYVAYNRDVETGPPARLREALTDFLYEKLLPEPPASPAAPSGPVAAVQSVRVAGVYANTVGCFTCDEGKGWPLSIVPVQAEGPGIISLYGGSARFFAADTLIYRSESSGRELRFLTDDVGQVRYMVQGHNSFARLDQVLLDELLPAGWRARPAEPIVARVYRAIGAWPAAVRAYSSLAARDSTNGRYAFYEGFSLLHTEEWGAARAAFRRALEIGQWPAWSQYYIAGAHAGAGEVEAAWAALARALEMGFSDGNLLRTEPWWEQLRETEKYRRTLARLQG